MTTWTWLSTLRPGARRGPIRASFFLHLLLMGLLAGGFAYAPPTRAADRAATTDLRAGDDRDDRDDRDASESARVRYLEGDLKIERYDDDRVDEGSLNAPVFAGDVVTTAHGRGEVQLPSGTLVRIDESSRVTFLSLPSAEGGDEDTVLQVSEGTAGVEVRGALSRRKDFRIDTPSASVYLLAAGRYRIDVEGRYKKTRASAFRGVAEVVGDDGSVILRSGQRSFVGDTGEPESPRTFNTAASDAFDGWVEDRGGRYRRASASEQDDERDDALPDQIRPYSSELSFYGDWVDVAPYGPCWVPSGVSAGWRPYGNGYWAYGPGGNFWVSYDPWGWAPYHYGRWVFVNPRGWCWVPGSAFAPAWVSFYYGPSYFGWCPLDFWDFPCALRYGYPGYDFRCWNFVTYHNVYVRNVRKVFVNPGVVRVDLPRGVVVRHPVPLRPRDLRENRIGPPAILERARGMKTSQVDINAERTSKRSFRDTEKQVAHLSPNPRRSGSTDARGPRDAGRPSSGGRDVRRGDAERGRGRERDEGSQSPRRGSESGRGTDSGRPRLHGPERPERGQDRGRDDDKNRGAHGHGSRRSMLNDDLLPSRPREANDPVDSARSRASAARALAEEGRNGGRATLKPEIPPHLRGPGSLSDDDPRNGWGPVELFRGAERERGRSMQERPPGQQRPSETESRGREASSSRGSEARRSPPPRGNEARSSQREARQAPPPAPPPEHQREEHQKGDKKKP